MKISVVVVEYHSLEELKKCTETIQTAFSWEVEIIASSNSCYPPTEQERIKKEYNQFVWSFNDRNGGFAYAMNQGLKIATGDYSYYCESGLCLFGEDGQNGDIYRFSP